MGNQYAPWSGDDSKESAEWMIIIDQGLEIDENLLEYSTSH